MPANRVYRVLERLVALRLNNRRIRRIVADYLASRPAPELHTLKYRRRLSSIAAHFHLRLPAEESRLLFQFSATRRFETPLFESFRRAHHDARAIYELPYTVAEGLAARDANPPGSVPRQHRPADDHARAAATPDGRARGSPGSRTRTSRATR